MKWFIDCMDSYSFISWRNGSGTSLASKPVTAGTPHRAEPTRVMDYIGHTKCHTLASWDGSLIAIDRHELYRCSQLLHTVPSRTERWVARPLALPAGGGYWLAIAGFKQLMMLHYILTSFF